MRSSKSAGKSQSETPIRDLSRQWSIAVEYRDTHARAMAARCGRCRSTGPGGSPDDRRLGPSERQLHTVERVAGVRCALGAVADIFDELVINDSSWAGIAERLGAPAKPQKPGVLALQGFAEAW
jgi:hypothetical protein